MNRAVALSPKVAPQRCALCAPLSWCASGAAAAIAASWLAAKLHAAGFAPLGLLPLGIGVLLGAALAALAAALRLRLGARLLAGAFVLALVAVVAEHAWLYRDFRQQWHEARATEPQIAIFRPESPWSPNEYFRRELTPKSAALWTVDAALIVVGTVGSLIGYRRPNPKP